MAGEQAERADGADENLDVRRVVVIRIDRRILVAILMCFLSCVLMCGATLAFAVNVAHQEGRNFCELLGTYDQVYRDNPPSTETGRTLAVEVHRLVVRLGCDS